MATSYPARPPDDGTIGFTFWTWANKLWNWVLGETNLAPVQTAAFTADNTHYFYPVDPTAGSFNVTLPLASSCQGKKFKFKRVDIASANIVTLVPSGADTISPQALSIPSQVYEIISDGVSKWYVIGIFATQIGTGVAAPFTSVQFNDSGVPGGSANFEWNKATNILTILGSVTATTLIQGPLHDKGGMVADVKAYGAIGDGTTDDTTAIQAALNSGAGTIYFPKASYKTTAALTFTSGDRTVIEGNGSIIQLTDATGLLDVFKFGNNTGSPFGAILQNIVVRRSEVATAGAGVRMDRANGCKLVNVTCYGNAQLFYGVYVYRTIDAWILNCDIEHCLSHAIHAEGTAATVTSTNLHCFDNMIQYNTGRGINCYDFVIGSSIYRNTIFSNGSYGIVLDASVLANSGGDFEISQNNIDTNGSYGIYIDKYGNVRLNDNWWSNNVGNINIKAASPGQTIITGNLMYGDATNIGINVAGPRVAITGNYLYNGTPAIRLEATALETTITGNEITNATGWGVDLNLNPDQTTITGNMFSGNGSGDIRVGSSTKTVIAGNAPDGDTYLSYNGAVKFGGVTALFNISGNNGYTTLKDGTANNAVLLGGSGDPANYYRNTTHVFGNIGGATTFATLNVTKFQLTNPIQLKGYTVATLPGAPAQGMTAYCTDLLAPGFLVAAVGGGGVVGPVFYNGAAWVAI